MKKKVTISILSLVVVVLIAVRLMLPDFLLKKLNSYLEDFSPLYYAHVEDLDLSIFRTAVQLNNFEIRFKKASYNLLVAKEIDVSLAWRELFKSKILLDIKATKAKAYLSKPSLDLIFQPSPKEPAKKVTKEEDESFFVKIDNLSIEDSYLQYGLTANAPEAQTVKFNDLNLYFDDISPQNKKSLTQFRVNAKLPPAATLKIKGEAKFFKDPTDWNMDLELKNFYLPSTNPVLVKVPLTFNKGHLDVILEVKSENSHLQGYIKPFLNDVDMVGDKKDFKNGKHFFLDIFSAFGNFIFKNPETDTVASKIYFERAAPNEELKVDTKAALKTALKYEDDKKNVRPTFSQEIHLKNKK